MTPDLPPGFAAHVDHALEVLDPLFERVIGHAAQVTGHHVGVIQVVEGRIDVDVFDLLALRAHGIAAAEEVDQVIDYLRTRVPEGAAPLCGNSIGVDRRFLDRYLPVVDQYVHYRSIDVSSFKELCRRWYPEVYRKRPGKAEHHRALEDIKDSIEELRFYRDNLLRLPE